MKLFQAEHAGRVEPRVHASQDGGLLSRGSWSAAHRMLSRHGPPPIPPSRHASRTGRGRAGRRRRRRRHRQRHGDLRARAAIRNRSSPRSGCDQGTHSGPVPRRIPPALRARRHRWKHPRRDSTADGLRCSSTEELDPTGFVLVVVRCTGAVPALFGTLGDLLPVNATGRSIKEGQ